MHIFKRIIKRIKWIFQKTFRRSHASDYDLWGLDTHLSKIIFVKLKDFIKMKKCGHPIEFCEYNKNSWPSKDEYDAAVAKGNIVGGGLDMWNKYLTEMLFGFAWNIAENFELKKKDLKWLNKMVGSWLEEKTKLKQLKVWKNTKLDSGMIFNYPRDLYNDMSERAYNGIVLFGKFFHNLWD